MGLTSKTQSALAKAFNGSLADAVKEVTFILNISSAYDELTQTVVHTTEEETSRGVFVDYERNELKDSAIINTDDKLIVLQNELTLVPAIDMIISAEGYVGKVINVRKDPANIQWELQCRQ